MPVNNIVTRGEIRADGTLEIRQPLNLPPGEVEVTVTPIATAPANSVWDRLDAIWQAQQDRGHQPRSRDEVNHELDALRDEWDDPTQQPG